MCAIMHLIIDMNFLSKPFHVRISICASIINGLKSRIHTGLPYIPHWFVNLYYIYAYYDHLHNNFNFYVIHNPRISHIKNLLNSRQNSNYELAKTITCIRKEIWLPSFFPEKSCTHSQIKCLIDDIGPTSYFYYDHDSLLCSMCSDQGREIRIKLCLVN